MNKDQRHLGGTWNMYLHFTFYMETHFCKIWKWCSISYGFEQHCIWFSGSTIIASIFHFDIICCHFWFFGVHGTRSYTKFHTEKLTPRNVGLFSKYFYRFIRYFPNSWPLRCWINW